MRNLRVREAIGRFRRILDMLTTDKKFLEFHEGRSQALPEFYHREYERLLGSYASLMPREERTPLLVPNRTADPLPVALAK